MFTSQGWKIDDDVQWFVLSKQGTRLSYLFDGRPHWSFGEDGWFRLLFATDRWLSQATQDWVVQIGRYQRYSHRIQVSNWLAEAENHIALVTNRRVGEIFHSVDQSMHLNCD